MIPASHIRGFRRGIRDEQNGHLRLAIKQYVPKRFHKSKAGDCTLIFAHGIDSSKESYEPFYDELLNRGLPIGAVWAMDVAHHGASYLLNEGIIGDEPNWYDSSRDMMQMVNYFQELMPPPLFAIGQSWGTVTIATLSLMHPRLFAGVVFLEPTFAAQYSIRAKDRADRAIDRSNRGVAMVKRQDIWPSLAIARERLRATPYYGAFDHRVFERVMKHDFRRASAERCAEVGSPDAVTLILLWMAFRKKQIFRNRPDDIETAVVQGFYRGEVVRILGDLQYILPSTLLVWAGKSLAGTRYAKEITSRVGVGYGGNGGVAGGRVQSIDIPDMGHPLPLEKPGVVANAVSDWLLPELARWKFNHEKPQPPYKVALDPEIIARITKL